MIDLTDSGPPSLTLRPYQNDCISAVNAGWREVDSQLIVMAGGCGKTVVFANLAMLHVKEGGRVLILAHTDELLEQAIDKICRATGISADKEKADRHASLSSVIVVASVQTLSRPNRAELFPRDHFSLIIVDEAHRALATSYRNVLKYFSPGLPKVLGVTATAGRGDKRSLGEVFKRVAFEYGLLEAVRDGYLVRPIVKNIPLKIDLRGIRIIGTSGGADLDLREVADRIHPLLLEVAKILAEAAAGLKTVVFTPSVQIAKDLAAALNNAGLKSSYVSGECPDREEKIAAFRAAPQGVCLCNALLVVEGFDVPDISGVCILRPTKIWPFFVQAAVRGTRTLPGVIDGIEDKRARLTAIATSAKPHFTLIDFLWLTDRMDLIAPVDLVVSNPALRDQMLKLDGDDIVANQEIAQRNMLRALAEEARRHARRQARVIDPIAMSVAIGDAALATWEPETDWDASPPTQGQLSFLLKNGLDVSKVRYKGYASRLIWRVLQRLRMKLATPRQLSLLAQLNVPEEQAAVLTITEATQLIDQKLTEKRLSRHQ